MTFLSFIESVFKPLGPTGGVLIAFVGFLVGFGIYKFVKDWLPW